MKCSWLGGGSKSFSLRVASSCFGAVHLPGPRLFSPREENRPLLFHFLAPNPKTTSKKREENREERKAEKKNKTKKVRP